MQKMTVYSHEGIDLRSSKSSSVISTNSNNIVERVASELAKLKISFTFDVKNGDFGVYDQNKTLREIMVKAKQQQSYITAPVAKRYVESNIAVIYGNKMQMYRNPVFAILTKGEECDIAAKIARDIKRLIDADQWGGIVSFNNLLAKSKG